MTHAKFLSRAVSVLILIASPCLVSMEASAQTQPQGMTVGSPPPPSKPTRAGCTKQGKDQGLSGSKLSAFVKTCMKG
jgi:hypothetical protein